MQSLLPGQEMPKKVEVAEICPVDALTCLGGKRKERGRAMETYRK